MGISWGGKKLMGKMAQVAFSEGSALSPASTGYVAVIARRGLLAKSLGLVATTFLASPVARVHLILDRENSGLA
jgi:hypothetical protein